MNALSKGFDCLIYPGANARPQMASITNIYEDDAQFFDRIGAKTSMEPAGDQYALYADIGLTEEDDETPREIIILSGSDNSQDSFKRLRAACEQAMAEATS